VTDNTKLRFCPARPYVLPILPIVLGAAASERKYGPAALGAGLAVSFVAIGVR
jgi:cytochrome c-type biogenesis protein